MGPIKTRIQRLLDESASIKKLHESVVANVEGRDDKELNDVEREQLDTYNTRQETITAELTELNGALEREQQALEVSKKVRSHLAATAPGVVTEDGLTKYRSFAVFARDHIIARFPEIAQHAGGNQVREAARERLARAPQHTLTEDIAGLLPPQHIAQIMDVIDKSRPVVATSRSVNLEKGKITYPKITQRPTVEKQTTEKTEGGTAEMKVAMQDANAVTFVGGGNLSWQAINWSSPDALALWFDLAAESYARQSETYACTELGTSAVGTITAPIAGTSSFPQWLSGVVAGMAGVYDASGAMADTLYLSPDFFFIAAALTSDQGASLINAGGLNLGSMGGSIGGLRVVTSYGFGTATAIVGDSSGFLVAETAGAPVELRAVEPAIGGMEVGLIGAFAAEVMDANRFVTVSA